MTVFNESATLTPHVSLSCIRQTVMEVSAVSTPIFHSVVAWSDPVSFAELVPDIFVSCTLGEMFTDSDDDNNNPVVITVSGNSINEVIGNAKIALIDYTVNFDPDTNSLVTVETGVTLDAEGTCEWAMSSVVYPTLNTNATAFVTTPSLGISAFSILTTSIRLAGATGDNGNSFIRLTTNLDAEADVSTSNADVPLDITLNASGTINSTQTAELNVIFDIAQNIIDITGPCPLDEYTPFNGSGPLTMPPNSLPDTSGETGFKLEYPTTSPSDTLLLPGPNLGNVQRLNVTRINRETRGGKLIVFRDSQWPQYETMVVTFSGLSEDQAYAVRDFMRNHLGKLIRIVDYENRAWNGIINDPSPPVVQDSRSTCNGYTAGFEFQGARV